MDSFANRTGVAPPLRRVPVSVSLRGRAVRRPRRRWPIVNPTDADPFVPVAFILRQDWPLWASRKRIAPDWFEPGWTVGITDSTINSSSVVLEATHSVME